MKGIAGTTANWALERHWLQQTSGKNAGPWDWFDAKRWLFGALSLRYTHDPSDLIAWNRRCFQMWRVCVSFQSLIRLIIWAIICNHILCWTTPPCFACMHPHVFLFIGQSVSKHSKFCWRSTWLTWFLVLPGHFLGHVRPEGSLRRAEADLGLLATKCYGSACKSGVLMRLKHGRVNVVSVTATEIPNARPGRAVQWLQLGIWLSVHHLRGPNRGEIFMIVRLRVV